MSPVSVHHVKQSDFGEIADRLAAVYVSCFAAEPWYEVFQPQEVITRMREVLGFESAVLLVAAEAHAMVGATLHYPLHYNKDMVTRVASAPGATMYCEELFVAASHRRSGIGGRLFDTAVGMSMAMGFQRRVLRTSAEYEQAKRFYASRNFRVVDTMQCRSLKRVGGQLQHALDSRVVMLQESITHRL